MPKGQALIEFAFILPILLFLVLGGMQLALLGIEREELGHAAREAAIVGCPAEDTVQRILGRLPETVTCETVDDVTSVTLADPVARVAPFFGNLTVTVTGRAVPRPSPSP